ncbi:MAG: OmpA family protein [Alphaproteobacteria bacterium]|nr:OmpA family protein [Alphaproteobacteria bacterium]MBN2675063.1 OmpA family protein [Alphaproteobacteria bacterium]
MLNIRFREKTNTWPGFVDLFSNLVIILIFLLIVFVFLWTTTSVFNKSTGIKTIVELKKTNAQQSQSIIQMTADEQEAKRLLILARSELENLQNSRNELENKTKILENKTAELQNKTAELQNKTVELQNTKTNLEDQINQLGSELQEKDMSLQELVTSYENKVYELQKSENDMQEMIALLNSQLNQATVDKQKTSELEQQRRKLQSDMEAQRMALSEQLAKLQASLDAAEAKSQSQEIQYVELSSRLNKALADKVAELTKVSQYQSDFYKAIKLALGDRTSIKQDGDRFIISSDILFASGEYTLSPEGKNQLRLLANVIKDLEGKIPTDVNWIIRVDGHTDRTPVIPGNPKYKNNTQLSLLRATAVSDELSNSGVSKRRLIPSGFGEMYPVELGNDSVSLQKNRRIELRLTNR